MTEIVAVGFLIQIVKAVIALLITFWMLRLMDKKSGFNLWEWIDEKPDYLAHYLGLRFVGVCLLVGLLIS